MTPVFIIAENEFNETVAVNVNCINRVNWTGPGTSCVIFHTSDKAKYRFDTHNRENALEAFLGFVRERGRA